MREIKTARCHFFLDGMNRRHGEHKSWYDDGDIYSNEYYVAGHIVHDFLANPLSDEEKVLLVLKYGGQLLPVDKNIQP